MGDFTVFIAGQTITVPAGSYDQVCDQLDTLRVGGGLGVIRLTDVAGYAWQILVSPGVPVGVCV